MSITTASTSAKTAEPTPATTNAANDAETATASKQYLKLAGLILGLSTVLILMLLSFVTPLLNSGAKDLPLAVGGPDMVTTKITQDLEANPPTPSPSPTTAPPRKPSRPCETGRPSAPSPQVPTASPL